MARLLGVGHLALRLVHPFAVRTFAPVAVVEFQREQGRFAIELQESVVAGRFDGDRQCLAVFVER
ncbi:hypothetical protein D3C86_2169130 [compost metagenome]